MRKTLITLMVAISGTSMMLAAPAQAQFGPIEDIRRHPSGHPSAQLGIIETIPVNVGISSLRSLDGYSIVLNAYKPVRPGMSQPELIGQTRILLTGMPNNFGMAVMVPEVITRDLDFAVINGAVLDPNNKEVLVSRKEEFYKGRGTVELEMVTPGNQNAGQSTGQTTTQQAPIDFDKLKGKAYLPGDAPDLMRGASMTVELVEIDSAGLAGGQSSQTILSQTFVDLDKEKSPFKFKMEYPKITPAPGRQVILRAQVKDWAGRLMYEDYQGQPYRGEDDKYKIYLKPGSYQP